VWRHPRNWANLGLSARLPVTLAVGDHHEPGVLLVFLRFSRNERWADCIMESEEGARAATSLWATTGIGPIDS